jgi:hypothetical protein
VITEDWFMNIESNIKDDDTLFYGPENIYSKKVSDNNAINIFVSK